MAGTPEVVTTTGYEVRAIGTNSADTDFDEARWGGNNRDRANEMYAYFAEADTDRVQHVLVGIVTVETRTVLRPTSQEG